MVIFKFRFETMTFWNFGICPLINKRSYDENFTRCLFLWLDNISKSNLCYSNFVDFSSFNDDNKHDDVPEIYDDLSYQG